MASTPFLNNQVGVKVNSVDLSDHVTSVTLNRAFNELMVTAMGDSGQRQIKGLETSSITLDFLNDTTTSSVLQTLQAAWGTNVTVQLVQTKGNPTTTISATNPLYTMTCLVNNTTDINGAVGDLSTQTMTWNVTGTVAISASGTW
jgi:hypothetical protein